MNLQYKCTIKTHKISNKIGLDKIITKGNLVSHHHFTIYEHESILIYHTQGLNLSQITKLFHRHPSIFSREWKRHIEEGSYSPS